MFDKKNIRAYYNTTIKEIRSFLLSKSSKEFLVFLFFVFIAFVFWLFQVLNEDYESQFSMKVNLKNVPDNAVLTSELPRDLNVRLKDKGTILMNYWMGNSMRPLSLDFNEFAEQGTQVIIPPTLLKQKVKGQLSQSTELVSVYPDTLSYIYTTGEGKKVPVRLKESVAVDPRFYIAGVTYEPDSVMAYAPQEILDTIKAAYTASVKVEQLADTVSRRVAILKVAGAKFIPDYTNVALQADVYSEKTLAIPVRGMNFPPDKVLRTFPSKVNVTFQVGLSHFRSITPDDFFVAVSYEELLRSNDSKCTPHLKAYPKLIKHPRVSPENVDFIIEQQEPIEED